MTATIKTFGYPATLVKDFTKWVVLLRPQQATLGSVVLASSPTTCSVTEHRKEGAMKRADGQLLILSIGLAALLMGQTGCCCIKDHYVIQSQPKTNYEDLRAADQKPSLKVSCVFQSNGNLSPNVATKYRPDVLRVLKATRLFSSVQTSGSSEASMQIVMNNVYDSLGGAIAAGLFSGLTFGLIGTKITHDYVLTANYQGAGGRQVTKVYEFGITTTSGIIHESVEGRDAQDNVETAIREILEQFILRCLRDLQQEGQHDIPEKFRLDRYPGGRRCYDPSPYARWSQFRNSSQPCLLISKGWAFSVSRIIASFPGALTGARL